MADAWVLHQVIHNHCCGTAPPSETIQVIRPNTAVHILCLFVVATLPRTAYVISQLYALRSSLSTNKVLYITIPRITFVQKIQLDFLGWNLLMQSGRHWSRDDPPALDFMQCMSFVQFHEFPYGNSRIFIKLPKRVCKGRHQDIVMSLHTNSFSTLSLAASFPLCPVLLQCL